MADAQLSCAVEAAISHMQDSRVDAQSTLTAFTDHDIRTTWQLLALSDSDWQTVAPGLSIGMRAAIKALAARQMTQRQPAVAKEDADPTTEQQLEHAVWDDAQKFFRSTGIWVSLTTPWLQRLACSGQDPRSLRSAVCAWMEGYSITWLLFFATVTPTVFSVMRPVGHLDASYSNRAVNSTVDALRGLGGPRYGYASAEPFLNFVFALTSAFTICVLWISIYIARSTTHITNSLSDENFCLSLATLVPPLIEKVLALNHVVSVSMTLWVHLSMQLGCFTADDPSGDPDWWAMLLVHMTIEIAIWSTWGGTFPTASICGIHTLHWGIHTQLAVHAGLLDAAEVPISIEGKSRLQLLDELSAVALQRANGVMDYGGKNWRFARPAATRLPPADASSDSVRKAPTRRATGLGLDGGRRHEVASMMPWF